MENNHGVILVLDPKKQIFEEVIVELKPNGDIKYNEIADRVGGLIELVPNYNSILDDNRIAMWCNEEGKLIGLQPTVVVTSANKDLPSPVVEIVNGVIVFTSTKGSLTTSLNRDQIEAIKSLFTSGHLSISSTDTHEVQQVIEVKVLQADR